MYATLFVYLFIKQGQRHNVWISLGTRTVNNNFTLDMNLGFRIKNIGIDRTLKQIGH